MGLFSAESGSCMPSSQVVGTFSQPVVIKAVELTVVVVVSAVIAVDVVETAKRRPTKVERECAELRDQCLSDPVQPDWNRETFGSTKGCLFCFWECKDKGAWPDYKCPRAGYRPN